MSEPYIAEENQETGELRDAFYARWIAALGLS
jgi:hypothetical protein